ncbi:MAG: Sb-PDE family phosphodiesterase [Bacteroidota bacterium]|nr:Sb-PDE family phosphodiesterase [Bacteroidota bacterium]HHU97016.1 histidinol-phosphatase [Petrimonas sp.]
MVKKKILFIGLLLCSVALFAQRTDVEGMSYFDEQRRPQFRENIVIPDVNGYKVLKCDFHTHTVFSDGLVWPTIRLQEAWSEGLDAFALTEHIEYTPHKDDVKVNHNRAHEIIEEDAKKNNIILVKGSEVTRNTPPGHFNAIYIQDASGFIESRDASYDKAAVMKAAEQGAFIFWNHPGWQPGIKGSYEWIDFVEELYANQALHGIEVINGFGFHKKALDWCVDKNLTVMGTSDIHNLIRRDYDTDRGYVHRSMTLVMAKERTPEAIREALNAGRTVAWASKYLAGKEEHVRALFEACIELKPSHYTEGKGDGSKTNFYEITNNSDLYFELILSEGSGTSRILLYPQSSQLISATSNQSSLSYDVVSTYVRSDQHLNITFNLN